MEVTLLRCSHTDLAEFAAAVSVGHENDSSIFLSRQKAEGHDTALGMKHALESGHLGILEPVSISWFVEGISRACSHQLVRHQIGVA